MQDRNFNIWAVEYDTPFEIHSHALKEIFASRKTKYQKMDVAITAGYGKALLLDGRIQSCERDEYIYHESLVHPPMIAGPKPEKVLVIGGGEGATLREILRYPSVKKAVMVDIDPEVVEACREYLPEFHQGSFDDARTELVFGDGRKFVKETEEKFDVVIIDIPEPVPGGPAYLLYTVEFYDLVRKILAPGGRVVTQACTSNFVTIDLFSIITKTMERAFGRSWPYQCYVPSYAQMWGFSLSAPDLEDVFSIDVDGRLEEFGVSGLRYYDAVTHRMLFSLPKDIRTILSAEERIFTDENPPVLSF
ncbi:MAG: polyamine aminopropyltransferase [Deltaproteobacteria bacterium]|nr:MAG: polyamine aminopropyltransferase [Deltaproteobacteria bacterium]